MAEQVEVVHYTDPSCPFAFSAELQRLRLLWLYGDQNARAYFYGDSCTLCRSPWISQRKNWF